MDEGQAPVREFEALPLSADTGTLDEPNRAARECRFGTIAAVWTVAAALLLRYGEGEVCASAAGALAADETEASEPGLPAPLLLANADVSSGLQAGHQMPLRNDTGSAAPSNRRTCVPRIARQSVRQTRELVP
jgi:hypothetical protein